jgi:hypothetical protein
MTFLNMVRLTVALACGLGSVSLLVSGSFAVDDAVDCRSRPSGSSLEVNSMIRGIMLKISINN